MSIDLSLRDAELIWRIVDGELIVLDLAGSVYLTANRTGALLWEALAGGATRAELAALLIRAFPESGDTAAEDVERFLRRLAEHRLLLGSAS